MRGVLMKSLLHRVISWLGVKDKTSPLLSIDSREGYLANLEYLRVEALRIGDLALYDELTDMVKRETRG